MSKQVVEKEDENRNINIPHVAAETKEVKYVEAKSQQKTGEPSALSSAIPPPKRFSEVRKQQELKIQGFSQPNIPAKGPQIITPQTAPSLTPQSQTVVMQSATQQVLNQQRD